MKVLEPPHLLVLNQIKTFQQIQALIPSKENKEFLAKVKSYAMMPCIMLVFFFLDLMKLL